MRSLFVLGLLALSPGVVPAAGPKPFALVDGDRVVFLGNTLIEREQRFGYWEAALTARFPNANVTFRNLGWSGDTVFGEARASFDPIPKGFERIKEHVTALKPTVLFIGYGTNESFEGPAGLEKFVQQYKVLLDSLAGTKARVVLLSPLKQEDMGRPLPDPTRQNMNLKLYSEAVEKLAKERGLLFVDLYNLPAEKEHLTENGIHLSALGYWRTADVLLERLGVGDAGGDGRVRLKKPDDATANENDPGEKLRKAIVEKNRLYFYRWRPQNETYLFGFRKYEQGRNAIEIPAFDPLIEKAEKEIAVLRMPSARTLSGKQETSR